MLLLSPRKGFWVSTGDLMGVPKSNIVYAGKYQGIYSMKRAQHGEIHLSPTFNTNDARGHIHLEM
jgi:hypothetical protein